MYFPRSAGVAMQEIKGCSVPLNENPQELPKSKWATGSGSLIEGLTRLNPQKTNTDLTYCLIIPPELLGGRNGPNNTGKDMKKGKSAI